MRPSQLDDAIDEAARAVIPILTAVSDLALRGPDEPVCHVRECQQSATQNATVTIFRHPDDVELTTYRVELCAGHADRWAIDYGSGGLTFAGFDVVSYAYAARR